MKALILIVLCSVWLVVNSQVLPADRAANWVEAGVKTDFNPCFVKWIGDFGADSTGVLPSDGALSLTIAALDSKPGLIVFSEGTYSFTNGISLPSHVVLRGQGAGLTTLEFDLGGSNNLISIVGGYSGGVDSLTRSTYRGDTFILVNQPENFAVKDYFTLFMDDLHLVTDSWAENQVAHILQIIDISMDTLFLDQSLRLDYDSIYYPRIRKIIPKQNVGIENLKIIRLDQTAGQTKNIFMVRAVNCWVKGVESDHCNFGHIVLQQALYCEVSGCHMYDAFGYGGGGKAYGVVVQGGSNMNRIENNVFNHLRHSILFQSGANGNVCAYNYSTDPFWSEFLSNLAGDLLLHGNFPFENLFESNVVANIRIDAAHGKNGPYNTLFRNRAELYGLIMSSSPASNAQNIIGNEITLSGFPFGNYLLAGTNHFEYGNNVQGTTQPSGTADLVDISYAYGLVPHFLNYPPNWPHVGYPNALDQKTIPAQDRYSNGVLPYTYDAPSYSIQSGVNIWTGCAINNNWHDISNWSLQILPNENTDVEIRYPADLTGHLPKIYLDTAFVRNLTIIAPAHLVIESPGYLLLKEE